MKPLDIPKLAKVMAIANDPNERWTRLFGQFLGLNKLYPVVVMPPF
ncbi:hypothetical protein [Gluconobacter oxydans]|nr:hypothetical protein [Gluconobacter oxydans]